MIRFSVHYFLLFTLMATVFPYFQLFLRSLGFDQAEVGYLQGLLGLANVAGPMGFGYLADRLGRRRGTIAVCLLLFGVLLLPLVMTDSFWLAAVLVFGLGTTVRTAIPLTDTLASLELPDPTRRYGHVRIWGSIGFLATLLSVRALGLIDETSARSMMFAMVVAAGLCLLSSRLLPEARRGERQGGIGGSVRDFDGVFWLFLAAAALHQLGMSVYYSFFTLYLHDRFAMEQAAWVWAIGAAAETPLLFVSGWIIRRTGLAAMLVVSMASVSVRMVVYALAPDLWLVLPTQLLHAAAFGLFHAASIEFLRRKVSGGRRGLAMALYMSLAIALPAWLGSSIGGEVAERWGYTVLFLCYAVPPLAGIAVLLLGAGRRINAADPTAR